MGLNRAVLLVHCGEQAVQTFCKSLEERLTDVAADFAVVTVDCLGPSASPAASAAAIARQAGEYVRALDISTARYDRELATPSRLEKVRVPLTVFCVTPDAFQSRVFRNLFVHHTEAAGMVSDVHTLPILFDTDHQALTADAIGDEHLAYTLRRAHLVLKSEEKCKIEQLAGAVLGELPVESAQRRQQARRALAGRVWTAISFLAQQIALLGLVVSLLVLLATWIARRPDVGDPVADVLGMCAALLVGLRLSDMPATPAFEKFRRDAGLYLKKSNRHWRGLAFPTLMLFGFGALYGPHARHSLLFIAGLVLGIVEQHYRYAVFQRRLRLAGADNYAEHMACRILPVLARVAPSRVPSRVSFESGDDWFGIWDLYAMRLMPSSSRTFLSRRPRVFISYRWADEKDQRDADLAADVAERLRTAGVSHFLDNRVLRRGLPFRSRIAVEIAEATHFLLLLSKRTVAGATCGDEARQALACLPISMWPRILVCLLDEEKEIRAAAGDPVFAYLLERADRVTLGQLADPAARKACLKKTKPESFLHDFARWLVPPGLGQRRRGPTQT